MSEQTNLWICFSAVGLIWLAFGCSELRDPTEANLAPEVSVHPEGWRMPSHDNFHGQALAAVQWDMSSCKECHGQNYDGGISESSCLACHENTPEDCSVCHGDPALAISAPPPDLSGNIDNSARGVGAHQIHLQGGEYSDGFACTTCHSVPSSFDDPAHIDANLPAEITFGQGLAFTDGATPAWNQSELSCSNSYCHGNWSLARSDARQSYQSYYVADVMRGGNQTPVWTDSDLSCNECHGLPPEGHEPFELEECWVCHEEVVGRQGQIIDKSKHVNGMVNVFEREYPIF